MSQRAAVFLWSLLAGILSASLAGLVGTVWGVPQYDPLTPASYRDALLTGAILGIIPTLVIAWYLDLFCPDTPRGLWRFCFPILTAAAVFPLVYHLAVFFEEWSRAGCN
jgi:hypothetical protein